MLIIKKEYIERFLYYDETSHSCLRWKVDVRTGRGYKRIVSKKESVAGSLNKTSGYWSVSIKGKSYKVHRLIIALHASISSADFVDHINGNRSDNKLANLRVVTRTLNLHNKFKYLNNTSGKTGVKWRVEKSHTRVVAQWHDSIGQRYTKSFSVSRYGLLPAFSLAVEYRERMIQIMCNSGCGYTKRHGK